MPGQCYSCATKFGIFKKELGCKNCGYSFCGSCLKKEIAVPRHRNAVTKVCNKCYAILSGKVKPEGMKVQMSVPENFRKRVEKLQNPNQQNREPTRSHAPQTDKRAGLSTQDRQIAQRLERLKEARRKEVGPVPSVEEMDERLRKLKGETTVSKNVNVYQKPDNRSQQEQINDLMGETHDMVSIEAKWLSPEDDVRQRLQRLRGIDEPTFQDKDSQATGGMNNLDKYTADHTRHADQNIGVEPEADQDYSVKVQQLICEVADELKIEEERVLANVMKDRELHDRINSLKMRNTSNEQKGNLNPHTIESDDEENEDEAVKRLVRQILEEQNLEERNPMPALRKESDSGNASETDQCELPWCCICTADGAVRCEGCDWDIYCNRCYREGHDKEDFQDHRTVPYKSPRSLPKQ